MWDFFVSYKTNVGYFDEDELVMMKIMKMGMIDEFISLEVINSLHSVHSPELWFFSSNVMVPLSFWKFLLLAMTVDKQLNSVKEKISRILPAY